MPLPQHTAARARPERLAHRLALLLAAALLAAGFARSAPAGDGTAADAEPSIASAQLLVENTTARVLAAMSRDGSGEELTAERAYDIVARIVMPSVDLERTSRLVLGQHWSSASEAQRARFMQVFGDQLIRTYVLGISDYLAVSDKLGLQIDYLPGAISETGRVAVVRSKVGMSATSVKIDYRLHRFGDGWRVFDVLVEGVSVASTYRSSFMSEASRNGMDGLIERIAEKNRSLGPA